MTDVLHTSVYGLHEGDGLMWYLGMTMDVVEREQRHRDGRVKATREHITPTTAVVVLDEVTGTLAEVQPVEQLWIDGLRSIGHPLVNTTKQTILYTGPHSDRTREAISTALTGKPSPGNAEAKRTSKRCHAHLARLAESRRGVPRSPEINAKVGRKGSVPWNKGHRQVPV
jgi:hypothetical protein